MLFRVHNTQCGTDLGEYEAATVREALAAFLADTDDEKLNPNVVATVVAEEE